MQGAGVASEAQILFLADLYVPVIIGRGASLRGASWSGEYRVGELVF